MGYVSFREGTNCQKKKIYIYIFKNKNQGINYKQLLGCFLGVSKWMSSCSKELTLPVSVNKICEPGGLDGFDHCS